MAQVKLGDNPATINSNAALEIESSNKGLLIPRVNLTGITNVTPLTGTIPEGMIVYNKGNAIRKGLYYWSNSRWNIFVDSAAQDAAITNAVSNSGGGSNYFNQNSNRGLAMNTNGSNNTAAGNYSFTAGQNNTAGGTTATGIGLGNNASGNYSVAIGQANTSSNSNATAIGLNNTANAPYSVAIGQGNTASNNNATAIGLNNNVSGLYAVGMGQGNTASSDNATAIGLNNNASGLYAVAIGQANKAQAQASVAMGNNTTASGQSAFSVNEMTLANGKGAAAFNYKTEASGDYATAFGNLTKATGANAFVAGASSNANGNTAIAMGQSNTANGTSSVALGKSNTAGNEAAVAIGFTNNAGGQYSAAIGDRNNASGTSSVAIGFQSAASGNYSAALGREASANADNSVAIGYKASNGYNSGSLALSDGSGQGVANTAGNQFASKFIGGYYMYTNNNKGTFMNENEFRPLTDGNVNLGTSGNRWNNVYAMNGVVQTSDKRIKTNIMNMEYGLNTVMKMRPVTYNWKSGSTERKIGFVAQEVQQIVPEVVHVGEDANKTLGVNYAELTSVLVKAIQEQQMQIQELSKEVQYLRAKAENKQ